MARDLGIAPKDRAAFRAALAELESRGEIEQGRKSRFHKPGSTAPGETVRGVIRMARDRKRRSARLLPDDPEVHEAFRGQDSPRLHIPARHLGTALDGDTVEAVVEKAPPPKWMKYARRSRARARGSKGGGRGSGSRQSSAAGEPEEEETRYRGRVVRVVDRAERTIVGIFHGRGRRASIAPEDGRLPAVFELISVLPQANPGDVVAARFLGWDDPDRLPTTEMIEVLGPEDAPGVDMLQVIHRHGLPLEFPPAVLAEAETIDEAVSAEEVGRREDWRDREVFTIDPVDAKDFDDAIHVVDLVEGGWELAVHIADVSHYVPIGSALDREARRRGNSVYLADRVIPMLPEKLSNGVCSLKPEVDRLTHAVVLRFDEQGREKGARFVSAVIRSRRGFSYEEAMERMRLDPAHIEAMESGPERRLAEHLGRAWKLASLLRQRRFAAGALDLDFPEVKVVLDEKGRAVDIRKSPYDESHQLIEEFMLAANEAVAREIRTASAHSIYRIHEDPDPLKLEEFADRARSFGHRIGDVSHRPELRKLLVSIRGTMEEHSLKIALLKSLRRAAYSTDSLGHYGLSKRDYTHFTSPIRRYADLVVHRVLRRILSKRHEVTAPERPDRVPRLEEMSEIASHISKTERIAADAEAESQQIKMIEYLERICREDPEAVFPGAIHEVRPIGAFVELDDLQVKGLIRRDDLDPAHGYAYDRVREHFRGREGLPPLAVGIRLDLRLARVNRERGFLDFVPA